MSDIRVNGTMIWYYFICKREVWMISRNIEADQSDSNIDIGRFIHEKSYIRDMKEVSIDGMKIDRIKREGKDSIVSEIKKSSKYEEASKMQLLLYLQALRESGIEAKGVLKYPTEKKNVEVELNKSSEKELEKVKRDILRIIYAEKPLSLEKNKYCSKCAYKEMCWCDAI